MLCLIVVCVLTYGVFYHVICCLDCVVGLVTNELENGKMTFVAFKARLV
jgi:hypothetical protein